MARGIIPTRKPVWCSCRYSTGQAPPLRLLRPLLARAPKTAMLYGPAGLQEVATDAIVPGNRLLIRNGDAVPVDGAVGPGASALPDAATLTGESLPARHDPGQSVLSGSVNVDAAFDLVLAFRAYFSAHNADGKQLRRNEAFAAFAEDYNAKRVAVSDAARAKYTRISARSIQRWVLENEKTGLVACADKRAVKGGSGGKQSVIEQHPELEKFVIAVITAAVGISLTGYMPNYPLTWLVIAFAGWLLLGGSAVRRQEALPDPAAVAGAGADSTGAPAAEAGA